MHVHSQPIRPASVGVRVVAALIDLALLIGLFVVMAKNMGTWGDGEARLEGLPAVAYFACCFLYYFALEAAAGATIGKLVVGLRVVGSGGAAITPGQAAMRTLVRAVDGLPVLYLVGFILVMTDDQRRRLGDRAAKTSVVRASDRVAAPSAR